MTNVYYKVEANNFKISRVTGKKSIGGNYESFYGSTEPPIATVLKRRINEGLLRFGGVMGVGMEYHVFSFMALGVTSEMRFYGNLLDTSESSTVISGGLFNLGLNFSTKVKF